MSTYVKNKKVKLMLMVGSHTSIIVSCEDKKKQKNEANDYIELGYLRIVHGKLGQVYRMGFWESLAQFQGFG